MIAGLRWLTLTPSLASPPGPVGTFCPLALRAPGDEIVLELFGVCEKFLVGTFRPGTFCLQWKSS
jgi:hypothetical protein